MSGGYAVTAQYYDPLMAAAHADIDCQIAAALTGLDTTAGPVVDVGAGTGLSTALIARTLPAAAILAVEPDPAMRPALMARVWTDPDLRRRVSILPTTISDAPLPPVICGAVVSAALVHFSPADRAELWRTLAARLDPAGRVVVEIQSFPSTEFSELNLAGAIVGDVVYRGTASTRWVQPDRLRWHMTYQAQLGSRVLARDETVFECWDITAEAVLAEARLAGLAGSVDGDLVLLCTI